MSDLEIKLAAKGAASGPRDGESEKSRKRRAMAGCSLEELRSSAGFVSAADCNQRVLAGDLEAILAAMDKK